MAAHPSSSSFWCSVAAFLDQFSRVQWGLVGCRCSVIHQSLWTLQGDNIHSSTLTIWVFESTYIVLGLQQRLSCLWIEPRHLLHALMDAVGLDLGARKRQGFDQSVVNEYVLVLESESPIIILTWYHRIILIWKQALPLFGPCIFCLLSSLIQTERHQHGLFCSFVRS